MEWGLMYPRGVLSSPFGPIKTIFMAIFKTPTPKCTGEAISEYLHRSPPNPSSPQKPLRPTEPTSFHQANLDDDPFLPKAILPNKKETDTQRT